MGACVSSSSAASQPSGQLPTQPQSSPSSTGEKTQKLRTVRLDWTSETPITKSGVLKKRQTFWETCSSYGGQQDVWDALKGACETEELSTAQAILDAVGVILPAGQLSPCYDQSGFQYKVPLYCTCFPTNVQEDPTPEEENVDAYSNPSTTSTTSDKPDSSKSVTEELASGGEPMTVKVRLSTNEHALHKWQVTNKTTIGQLKSKVQNEDGIEPGKQRYFFGGKQLADKITLEAAGIQNGYTIQVIVNP